MWTTDVADPVETHLNARQPATNKKTKQENDNENNAKNKNNTHMKNNKTTKTNTSQHKNKDTKKKTKRVALDRSRRQAFQAAMIKEWTNITGMDAVEALSIAGAEQVKGDPDRRQRLVNSGWVFIEKDSPSALTTLTTNDA